MTSEHHPQDGTEDELVLRCRVGPFQVALPAPDVVEVHRAVAVTPLPGAPATIVGVVEVRGALVPVLDVRQLLGVPVRSITPSDALVMVRVPGRQLLLLVDEATSVDPIPAARVRDAVELVPGGRYLRDVAATPTGPLVITDLPSFLSSDEEADLAAALRALETEAPARAGTA